MIDPLSVTRRSVLVGIGGTMGAALLFGCGGSTSSNVTTTTSNATTTTSLQNFGLGARFPDGSNMPSIFSAGRSQRAPYVLLDEEGWPASEGVPDSIDLSISKDGNLVETVVASRHGELGQTPYYPLIFTPAETGYYEISLEGTEASHVLEIVDSSQLSIVQVGDPLPAVETPTVTDPKGIDLSLIHI